MCWESRLGVELSLKVREAPFPVTQERNPPSEEALDDGETSAWSARVNGCARAASPGQSWARGSRPQTDDKV